MTIDLDGDGILALVMAKISLGARIDGVVTNSVTGQALTHASLAFPGETKPIGIWSVSR